MANSLDSIFNPTSVAVIGASEVPGKASERRTRSLIEGGYGGKIYLINPKRNQVFSHRSYPSISDVEGEVDLVMVVVGARLLATSVSESIRKGAKGIVVITAGVGEAQGQLGEEGKKIEKQILDEALGKGTYIIGPNCSGLFSASADLNLLGVPRLKKGNLAVIAQSGNVIDSLTHYARLMDVGFSKIVSIGNAVGVKLHEYLEYLGGDPQTKVIAVYLEGIEHGDQLMKVARQVTKLKPIVALKAGRTQAGVRAVVSHTASLAGNDAIVDALLRQAGILRVSNVDDLFDVANVLLNSPVPKGNRVAILSEGGGDAAIAADNSEKYGLDVPVLAPATQKEIEPNLLTGMAATNPIDYGGTAEEDPHVIAKCAEACMLDDAIDAIYVTGFFGGFKDIIAPHVAEIEKATSKELFELVSVYQKPLVVHTSFARQPIESLDLLKANGIPVFESSERAAECLGALAKYAENSRKVTNAETPKETSIVPSIVESIFRTATQEKRSNLLETEARKLLLQYGICSLKAKIAQSASEACAICEEFGQPVAMKIVSPDIIHKSDVGCVKLDVWGREQVTCSFREIIRNAKKVCSEEQIVGVLVSPMAPAGPHFIVGMMRDPQFGPVLMFGLGGILVEVLRDVAFRILPVTWQDVDEIVKEIRGYRLLEGVRGEKPKDTGSLKELIKRLSDMAIANPKIREVDLNPVIVHESGASIVDVRIIISQ
jgi:acetyltransferase